MATTDNDNIEILVLWHSNAFGRKWTKRRRKITS
jgi:hypothetical protein